jgi:hypothetical protein
MADLEGVATGVGSSMERLLRGDGPGIWLEKSRGGEGVAWESLMRAILPGEALRFPGETLRVEGDTRRGEGDGDPKTSSGTVFGDGSPPEGTRLELRNGDFETKASCLRTLNAADWRGVRLPCRISGDSFSLLPETFRSPGDPLDETLGKATFRSLDTFLVPLTADPLGVRLADLGFAEMPKPIAALGVFGAPIAALAA